MKSSRVHFRHVVILLAKIDAQHWNRTRDMRMRLARYEFLSSRIVSEMHVSTSAGSSPCVCVSIFLACF